MTSESNYMEPALEDAVNQIRNEAVDDAVIEAAAARVWANLAAQMHTPLRNCDDFQALIPDFKAGRLPESRALLVKDHLHECVACRRIYEGKVTAMPARPQAVARKAVPVTRWAVAAAVVAAAGLSIWIAYDRNGNPSGRAIVQAVNGTLYEILPTGVTVLAAGQELPEGVEIRTAKDSDAMVKLKDGSVVEMRERSGFAASQNATDLTIKLGRGSIIVQAARRSSGHLYVATADCRVAVTGTVFSVTNGVKGSRVSVVEGEVHVRQDDNEKILHPGDQTVTSPNVEPVSVKDDIAWSRNREKLIQQLDSLRTGLSQIRMPQLRYSSKLMSRLPAETAFFASIPNLAEYLGQTQDLFQQKMNESPELREWWSGHGGNVEPILAKLRAGSEYLGEEIVVAGLKGANGHPRMPVFLAESKRPGFDEFLKQQHLPLTVEIRDGLVAFGPDPASVATIATALASPAGGFAASPFYARIMESYRTGAGIILAADLLSAAGNTPGGMRYFIAEEKQIKGQMEASASLGFEGPRTGIASWLAAPASMGALDYITPDAAIVTAFVVKNPAVIIDELGGMKQFPLLPANLLKAPDGVFEKAVNDLRTDLAASLGGEFSLSLDGSAIPVPSWKLVIEAYDPDRVQASLQKMVETYSRESVKAGNTPVKTTKEIVDGHTYYAIIGSGGPLTEIHYTFADGYLIAGPTRALLTRALQVKLSGVSIIHSPSFLALVPHDRYTSFSAVIYQNLGTTLAPIIGMFGGMLPQGVAGQPNVMAGLSNMKSSLIAAYGEPDRISIAANGNLLGINPSTLITGGLQGAIPFQMPGTKARVGAFK